MSHWHSAFFATLFVFCQMFVGTTIAEERDDPGHKPLILELKVESFGTSLRQEILVSEGNAFRVVTHDDPVHWIIEGDVERITDGIATVNLGVSVYGPGGFSITSDHPVEWKLKVDEFKGGGGGSNYKSTSDLWIRRGLDPIPILIKQLSAAPKLSVAAAYHLAERGAEAKPAIPALEKAAKSENSDVKKAAQHAIEKIRESIQDRQRIIHGESIQGDD